MTVHVEHFDRSENVPRIQQIRTLQKSAILADVVGFFRSVIYLCSLLLSKFCR